MPTYLVERYLPGRDRPWLEDELSRLPRERDGVRYLGSLYVRTDEVCLCRFEAADPQSVRDTNALAGLPFARIVACVELGTIHRSIHNEGDRS